MSNYSDGRAISIISDADLSAVDATTGVPTYLFRIVSIASSTANPSNRKCVLTTSNTDAKILGVLNNNPAAGEPASVVGRNAQGTFKVVVGVNSAAISIGDLFTADTDSGALKTTSSGDQVVGMAMEAGVAGQVIEYMPLNHKQQS